MAEPTCLEAAAQRERAATRQRATAALGELVDMGAEITFQSVARHAGVSRQWLYGQPDLRAQIERLRQRPRGGVPVRERSSDASLRQRLRGLLDDNRTLRDEVHALNAELAGAYGTQRANAAGARSAQAPRAAD
jgi:hypothetical protein